MQCPACRRPLSPRREGGLALDLCDAGCGGVWFDPRELEKVDERHEAAGDLLLQNKSRQSIVDRQAVRQCPRCPGMALQRHYYSVRQGIEVDDCPGCGGVWLDTGELAAIRDEFVTSTERDRVADAYFGDRFRDELKAQAAQGQADLARARKFAHALRFLCPSYWIPGKQPWGVF